MDIDKSVNKKLSADRTQMPQNSAHNFRAECSEPLSRNIHNFKMNDLTKA